MRVIFVNSFFYPDLTATSQLLSDVAFDLAASGTEVVTIAAARTYGGAPLPARETIHGVTIHRVKSPSPNGRSLIARAWRYLAFYVQAPIALLRLAKRGDVVVVKTDPPMLAVAMLPAIKLKGAVLVNWLQDLYPEVAAELDVPMMKSPVGRLLTAIRNVSLRRARSNIVIGKRMADRVAEARVPQERILVQPNWTDDVAIDSDEGENPLRKAWGLEGQFVLGYSGNLGRAHEIETFLAMADELRAEKGITFLFVGTGHLLDELKAEAAKRSLTNLMFQPHQDRSMLRHSLAVPDVHWISLRPALEGLIVPSKLYGVLAARRPAIVVGDVAGELSDYVERYGCGIQVDVGDGAGFAGAVRRLRDQPALREAMGQRGRDALERHFTRSTALAAMRAHLTGVLDQR